MFNPLSLAAYGMPAKNTRFDENATFLRSHIISPLALAIGRGIIALYCFTAIITAYSWLADNKAPNTLKDIDIPTYTTIIGTDFVGKSFSFFTFLSFWSLAFYFAVSSYHGLIYALNLRRATKNTLHWRISHLHDNFPRTLQLLHHIWYTTITTYPFVVSIVYWATMYGSPWPKTTQYTQWLQLSVHGLNSFFTILEIVFSAVRPPPFLPHLLVCCIIMSLYLGLAYLTKATQDFYVYEWMNPVWGWKGIVGHVLGYAGGLITIYCLVWVAMWLRERIAYKMFQKKESVTGRMLMEYAGSAFDSPHSSQRPSVQEPEMAVVAAQSV